MQNVVLFIRLTRPLFLVGAALVYALGVGIAHYLGVTIDWNAYLLGQAWVTIMQLGAHYLNEYFDKPVDEQNPNRTPFSGGSGALGEDRLPRATALIAAGVSMSVLASLTVIVIRFVSPAPAIYFLMLIAFIGSVAYSVPPMRLASSGYGELVTSIMVANLVPAFAFILQAGEFHRLLAMATFPLTALHLAMMLSFEFPDFATDLKFEKRTLLVRMGWRNAMTLHNLLILSAYLLLGLAMLLGLEFFIGLPALLTLPLGLLQIWQMRRIAGGARPNWTALTLNGVALFGAAAYLLTFSFWTR
jgi:1,4-dihydroxy-2-naphthoate octaprenyltransferase